MQLATCPLAGRALLRPAHPFRGGAGAHAIPGTGLGGPGRPLGRLCRRDRLPPRCQQRSDGQHVPERPSNSHGTRLSALTAGGFKLLGSIALLAAAAGVHPRGAHAAAAARPPPTAATLPTSASPSSQQAGWRATGVDLADSDAPGSTATLDRQSAAGSGAAEASTSGRPADAGARRQQQRQRQQSSGSYSRKDMEDFIRCAGGWGLRGSGGSGAVHSTPRARPGRACPSGQPRSRLRRMCCPAAPGWLAAGRGQPHEHAPSAGMVQAAHALLRAPLSDGAPPPPRTAGDPNSPPPPPSPRGPWLSQLSSQALAMPAHQRSARPARLQA